MKKKDINFAFAYVQVGVCGGQINLLLAINSIIWKNCPKDVFVSKKVLEIAVASATI